MSKFFFRCKPNPTAPMLVIESAWERREMEGHPDYEEVDAFGEVVEKEDPINGTIPFHMAGGRKK